MKKSFNGFSGMFSMAVTILLIGIGSSNLEIQLLTAVCSAFAGANIYIFIEAN